MSETQQPEALEVRAAKAKGWKWKPRMRIFHISRPHTVVWVREDEWLGKAFYVLETIDEETMKACELIVHNETFPDLDDAATRGAMLETVREVWRCPTAYVRQTGTRRASDNVLAWEVCDLWLDAKACKVVGVDREGSVGCWGHISEQEALVFALENAPVEKTW